MAAARKRSPSTKRTIHRRRRPARRRKSALRKALSKWWRANVGNRFRKRRRRRRRQPPLLRAAYRVLSLFVWFTVALAGAAAYYAVDLPDTSNMWSVTAQPAISILDRTGAQVATRGASFGEPVGLAQMPPHVPQAVIATEDRRFYHHIGIDPLGLIRASLANWEEGRIVQGGSTITQQLAKNLFLTNERTFKRKIQEVMLALWLEQRFTKDQILTLYLNRVYLGAGTYGIEAASQRYFAKGASGLSLTEAAVLAGLLKAPSRYAPTNDPARARARADIVLAAMVDAGFITENERATANATSPVFEATAPNEGIQYFADWVVDELPSYVGTLNQYYVVRTTLDARMQDLATGAIARAIDGEGAELKFSEAALVALDTDGGVRALVGGRSHTRSQFNRAVQAKRQPGSSFKPFVYLAALEAGLTPDSIVEDAPIRIGKWAPQNYAGKYEGRVTLSRALSGSLNTAAVRVAQRVGRDKIVEAARRMGLSSTLTSDATLPLGTSEVTLLDLTRAYVPFANGGRAVIPHAIVSITTGGGEVLYERAGSGLGRAADLSHIGAMNDMLTETLRSGTGRRANLGARPAAGKTGTSQESRDAWFIGYTADLVTGVWVGNDDSSPMKRVTGGTVPAGIWKDFMQVATAGDAVSPLPRYEAPPQVATNDTPTGSTGGNSFARFLKRIFSVLDQEEVAGN